MEQLVTIEIKDGVADVRLNRPDKINALSQQMFQEIVDAGERLATERGVRVVVLSGNGRGFCSGLDMASFQAMSSGARSEGKKKQRSQSDAVPLGAFKATEERPDNLPQRCAYVWKQLPVPVIGAIHGVAYGAGLQVALGADIRVARPDARLSVMEIKWGLIPDLAITQTLRDLVPLDIAKDLVFTGRILNGEEALGLGLVTELADDPLQVALEKAHTIASKSPTAIRAGKQLLEQAWHADPLTGLKLEASLQMSLIGSPNQVEAIKANFEKRDPQFSDPE